MVSTRRKQTRPAQASENRASLNPVLNRSPDRRDGEGHDSSSPSSDENVKEGVRSRHSELQENGNDEDRSTSSIEREEQQDDGVKSLLSELLPASHELQEIIQHVRLLGMRAENVHMGAENSSFIWPDIRRELETLHIRLMHVAITPLRQRIPAVPDGNIVVSNGDTGATRNRRRLIEECLRLGVLITIDSIFDAMNDKDPMPDRFRDFNVQAAGLLALETLLEAGSNAKPVLLWILCIVAPHCECQLFVWEKRYIPIMKKICLPELADESTTTTERGETSAIRALDQVKSQMKMILFIPFVHERQMTDFWQHVVGSAQGDPKESVTNGDDSDSDGS